HLYIVDPFTEQHAFNRSAGSDLEFDCDRVAGAAANRPERSQVSDQLAHIVFRQIEGGHAAAGNARPDKGGQLRIVASAQTRDDCRSERSAVAIGAMASGAAPLKQRAAGSVVLRRRESDRDKAKTNSNTHGTVAVYTPSRNNADHSHRPT